MDVPGSHHEEDEVSELHKQLNDYKTNIESLLNADNQRKLVRLIMFPESALPHYEELTKFVSSIGWL